MELGADDYITKPFNGTELLSAVNGRLQKIEKLKQEFLPYSQVLPQPETEDTEDEVIANFTSGRSTNKFKRREVIYSEGNHPIRLYYILKGKVRAYKRNDAGKEFATELFKQGDFVGHIALLEGTTYKDTAEAMEHTEVAVIPKEDFDELLATKPEVMKRFIRLLAKNISEKEEQLIGLAYNSLRRKVADALLFLQNKYQGTSTLPFSIDMTRENLATIAGTATESLIRTLGDFRTENIISMNDRVITIINPDKLKRLVN